MEALAMGDHGVYVWTVYFLGIVFLIGLGLYPILSLRNLKRKLSKDEDVK
ncbi:MAG: heme exporter protein CcmD [Gammaproteobacteria bacterium]|nr:heme exporter protein CcmD [Gammaproteobacteria bacterium]MYD80280.1 heme exporter protein CcmD [Gammaproteobacteria bacterium]